LRTGIFSANTARCELLDNHNGGSCATINLCQAITPDRFFHRSPALPAVNPPGSAMTYEPAEQILGNQISIDDIVDALEFLDDWEARYAYIIDIGKQMPPMPAVLKTDARIVRGCQSQVWLDSQVDAISGRLWLSIDSDALIVKGLAAIVLAAYNGKTPAEILAFDIDGLFARLDLMRHLSVTRGNGLRAMVKRIQDSARAA
jgi:cysteine desulfuration protein SufE